jgi:predicted MFS family arabinose efflux permease
MNFQINSADSIGFFFSQYLTHTVPQNTAQILSLSLLYQGISLFFYNLTIDYISKIKSKRTGITIFHGTYSQYFFFFIYAHDYILIGIKLIGRKKIK